MRSVTSAQAAAVGLERYHPPRLLHHRQAEGREDGEGGGEHEEHDHGQAQPGAVGGIVLHGVIVARGQDGPRRPGDAASLPLAAAARPQPS